MSASRSEGSRVALSVRAVLDELATRKRIPLTAHLDLTFRCNLACQHCYRLEQDRPELSLAEIQGLLSELKELGTFFVVFSGGEPTLRADFWEILEHARALDFSVRLKTNGLGVGEAEARRLFTLGVTFIDVSLLGASAGTHDQVTGVAGSFAATTRNLAAMVREGLHPRVTCSLLKSNFEEVAALHRLVWAIGIRALVFNPAVHPRSDGDPSPLGSALDDAQLRRVLDQPELAGLVAAVPDASGPVRLCKAGHSLVYVSPYGDASPCVAFPMSPGNIRMHSLSQLWNGPEFQSLRQVTQEDLPECAGCRDRSWCSRCPGQAWLQSGDFRSVVPESCATAAVRRTSGTNFRPHLLQSSRKEQEEVRGHEPQSRPGQQGTHG